ncbi:Putative PQ loop repeat protein (AFU_orthologue; AFUA_5G08410) [Aspergillus calidoustus]|uniref:Putative PQ loop repeat protein (AFU_orthologue AFUA_5G08410) n=1 Tax=Aspergillus calidoustus TaxID=454130 RepID=A0A0U5FLZ7_ASPCI|nr:Putative PQ loop repeat protein (AFU_orthologue; AFUA_5G08410) [Aspergillus calidoustus]
MDIPIAANILGTTGAVCWSIQLLPQIFINYRRHNTEGLQGSMMLLWASAGVPLGVYNIVEELNVALRVQAQILTFLSLVTWAQCLYYGKKYSIRKCTAAVVSLLLLLGGIEAGLIFALRVAKRRHLEWPMILMAVLSASLLAAGVLRHYWDIYVHRTVRGISFIFVGIDAAGDLFSLVSVIFERRIDVLGMVIYGTELVLWIGVFICGFAFNFLPWITERSRKEAAELAQERQISLHDMPSSTSVFRTASGSDVVTRRGQRRA